VFYLILRICDFFSGLHSWTKPYSDESIDVFSIDNNSEYQEHTTVIDDFLNLTSKDVLNYFNGERPHVIYASPPCTTFSVASIGHHWTGGKRAYVPKTDASKKGLEIVKHLNQVIEELNPTLYFIENPRGVLRKLNVFDGLKDVERITIWQCQYGSIQDVKRAKPTDIWTNSKTWIPKPVCKNGSTECDHVRAPRGAKSGTQGLPNNQIRSLIPFELCNEIKDSIMRDLR
jgi:hypothetical protein